MTDHNIHLAREKAEQLLKTLQSLSRQVEEESVAMALLANDLEYGSADRDFADSIVAYGYEAEDEASRAVRGIKYVLTEWPVPEMPPLDFNNLPDIVMYGATDEEAALHGMKGDH